MVQTNIRYVQGHRPLKGIFHFQEHPRQKEGEHTGSQALPCPASSLNSCANHHQHTASAKNHHLSFTTFHLHRFFPLNVIYGQAYLPHLQLVL